MNHPLQSPDDSPRHALSNVGSRIDAFAMLCVGGLTLLLVVVLGRVAQLQFMPQPILAAHMGSRTGVQAELPARGDLLDRRGRLLATTRFGSRIIVNPYLLKETPDADIIRLASAAGLSADDVGDRVTAALIENAARAADKPATPLRHLTTADGRPVTDPEQPEDAATDDPPASPDPQTVTRRRPIQYLPIGGVLTDAQADAVKALKLPWVSLERRAVREYPGGAAAAPIVGRVGFDEKDGAVGAEWLYRDELAGTPGAVEYARDAAGNPLWIDIGGVSPAAHGQDVRLSIDLELQRIAGEELMRGVEACDAQGGRLVMLDPNTGEILAMVDVQRHCPDAVDFPWEPIPPPAPADGKRRPRAADTRPVSEPLPEVRRYKVLEPDEARRIHPALGKNRCVEHVYEPGSTFKAFVWALITESGKAHPDEVFDTEGGRWQTPYGRWIEDVKRRDFMTWREVLINSSNIGMTKGGARLTHAQMYHGIRRFGFGESTGLGLPGETNGLITALSDWSEYTQTSVSYGYEVAVTPVQIVRAFSVFARQGQLAGTMPPIRLRAVTPEDARGDILYRVLKPRTAMLTRETMLSVADNMQASLDSATQQKHEWRYRIFGKSGTARIPVGPAPKGFRAPRGAPAYHEKQYYSSFLAAGPFEDPRLVVVVVIDDPGPALAHANRAYGALTAGPVVRYVLERSLMYLGVPPSPDADPTDPLAAGG